VILPEPNGSKGLKAYQACVALQCGQPTEVETGAWKTKPQWQL
jgi:hypothetical protein